MAYLLKKGKGYCTYSKPPISHMLTVTNNPKEKSALGYLYSRCNCMQKLESSGYIFNTLPITSPQAEQLVEQPPLFSSVLFGGG